MRQYGATSAITFSLAIQLAYFCVLPRSKLNLLATIKTIGITVAPCPKAPITPN